MSEPVAEVVGRAVPDAVELVVPEKAPVAVLQGVLVVELVALADTVEEPDPRDEAVAEGVPSGLSVSE